MHPACKVSTINHPAADSWQPLILLMSTLLLHLQRLTFKNSSDGFLGVLNCLDCYSVTVCFIITMCLLSLLWGQIRSQMFNLFRHFTKRRKSQTNMFGAAGKTLTVCYCNFLCKVCKKLFHTCTCVLNWNVDDWSERRTEILFFYSDALHLSLHIITWHFKISLAFEKKWLHLWELNSHSSSELSSFLHGFHIQVCKPIGARQMHAWFYS